MTAGENKVASPLPNHQCPLCGGPNGCAPAATGSRDSPCWCKVTQIPADVLKRVPEALRDKACICAACASGWPNKA